MTRKLANLKDSLPKTLKQLTEHPRIAFGSFADKTVLPYTSIAKVPLQNPCIKIGKECSPSYEFKHHLKLTTNFTEFSDKVKDAEVTGNLDDLEGGLSALTQAIVCKGNVGWRENSTKIVIYASNGLMHIAGEGLLGGAVRKNDCASCYLDKGTYHKVDTDYPSLACVHRALIKDKVFVIFAVTAHIYDTYLMPHKLMPQHTSVALLKNDSSNILDLVEDGYKKAISSATFIDDANSFLSVRYFTNCGDDSAPMREINSCQGTEVGKNYAFSVEVTLLKCPSEKKQWKNSLKIEEQLTNTKLRIDLEFMCGCQCEDSVQENQPSANCNSQGNLTCGQCECNPGWAGKSCSCDLKDAESTIKLNDQCLPPTKIPSKEDVEDSDWAIVDYYSLDKHTVSADDEKTLIVGPKLCSGKGDCECGECKCIPGFIGRYCECAECQRRPNSEPCGGPTRGTCDCGTCKCLPNWSGDDCSCWTDTDRCRARDSENVCSGNGECKCGKCKCHANAEGNVCRGEFCEICGLTNSFCNVFTSCAQCYVESTRKRRRDDDNCDKFCGKGLSNETEAKIVDTLGDVEPGQICSFQTEHRGKACHHQYIYKTVDDDKIKFQVLLTSVCRDTISAIALSGYIMLGTFLAGLAVMLLVWYNIKRKDAIEAKLFAVEEEKNKLLLSNTMQNPLYNSPITRVDLDEFKKDKPCAKCRTSRSSFRSSRSSFEISAPSTPMIPKPDHDEY
ncbi:integrin beta-nu-like [Ctenocephalides felis]|uniref:integrin beta-nu-like n=1 Tax=Ctenocephalides felis TaxID=7515 RepID=UPI000E6E1DD2|nr:integrin beta-nu-like [Ctenocephalides felis]